MMTWSTPRRWRMLETSDNVFALVVMAQIRAKATRNAEERKAWKFRLVRLMYDRGYERAMILELFRIIDWMIRLPAGLDDMLWQEAQQLEESTMVYVTSVERIGIRKGLEQGRKEGLQEGRRAGEAAVLLRQIELKFGTEAVETYRGHIERADAETLLTWLERILTAEQVDEIFGQT